MRALALAVVLLCASCSSPSGNDGGAGGGTGGTGGSGGSGGSGGTSGAGGGNAYFQQAHPWNTDVSALAPASNSSNIIGALVAAGGWGQGNLFLTDASIEVLKADANTPFRSFVKTSDFYDPDCDDVQFPVPVGGALEGESGYECVSDGDCHLIVHAPAQNKLFEMWRANIVGATFNGGCVAVWDLTRAYPSTLRGKGCTSADAAGFPIAAMLANADEVAAGEVKHALRFILPNARIRSGIYVPPSTHSTGPTAGGPNTPPYGVRFRLKSSFDTSGLSSGAKVLAAALKKYGMFLSDGGNIALTIQSDRFTTAKWANLGITSNRSLVALTVNDFEVVDYGTEVDWKADTTCYRNP
jgi:hypothetical protein